METLTVLYIHEIYNFHLHYTLFKRVALAKSKLLHEIYFYNY